jgi:hypothetical protein
MLFSATNSAVNSSQSEPCLKVDALKHLQNIFKCSQCTLVNDDPTILPCYHKLCEDCLKNCTPTKQKTNELVCPVCGTEHKLPNGGLAELSKNPFFERLKVTRKFLEIRGGQKMCDSCNENETEAVEGHVAVMFCTICQKKMCKTSYAFHKRFAKDHKTISLDDDEELCEKEAELVGLLCETHTMQRLSRYCFDCKSVTCESCVVEQHQQHDCVDVHEAVKRTVEELESKSKDLHACVAKCQHLTGDTSQITKGIESQIESAKNGIITQAGERRKEIDQQTSQIEKRLDIIKANRIRETSGVNDQLKMLESLVQAFLNYAEELKNLGKGIEIARQMSGLHDRAEELLKLQDGIGQKIADLRSNEVTFTAATETHTNLIGVLNAQQFAGKWT